MILQVQQFGSLSCVASAQAAAHLSPVHKTVKCEHQSAAGIGCLAELLSDVLTMHSPEVEKDTCMHDMSTTVRFQKQMRS